MASKLAATDAWFFPSVGKFPRMRWSTECLSRGELNDMLAGNGRWASADLCMATGERSHRIVVLDVDFEGDLSEAQTDFLMAHCSGKNQIVTTQSGGWHYYFRVPEGKDIPRNSVGTLCEGIDFRGEGGMVVLYNRNVELENIPEIPESLYALCMAVKQPKSGAAHDAHSNKEGGRNDTLTSFCGAWFKQGMTYTQVMNEAQRWGANCVPPMDANEVAKVVASVSRYHAPAEPGPTPTGPWPVCNLNDLQRLGFPPKDTICGVFKTASVAIVAGYRGTGKTLWMTDLMQAVASGEKFGPWEIEKPGKCLMLQLDMPIQEAANRAVQRQWHPDFHYMTRWQFTDAGMEIPRLTEASHHDAIFEALKGYQMVCFDTLRACQPPGAGDNMWNPGWWYKSQPIRNRLASEGVCMVFLHHMNLDGTTKDTSAIEDDADESLHLKPTDQGTGDGAVFQLERGKQRTNESLDLMYWQRNADGWEYWEDETRDHEIFEFRQSHTIKETAEEFGISESTVSRKIRKERARIRAINQA